MAQIVPMVKTNCRVTGGALVRTIRGMDRKTPADYKTQFIQRVVVMREAANYTQEDMASLLGITRDRYSKYEIRSMMPHHLIPKFCELTGFPIEYLLGVKPKRPQGGAPGETRKAG